MHLIGHSDGGNIALLVAMRRPDLLKRVAVIGANYHYKGLLPMEELRPGTPAFELWADKYAQHSPDGLVHAPIVLQKTLQMFAYEAIPNAQLAVVPGTSHAVLKERTRESVRILRHFLVSEIPVTTYMPLRRALAGD